MTPQVRAIQGDITLLDVDAIVNAANYWAAAALMVQFTVPPDRGS